MKRRDEDVNEFGRNYKIKGAKWGSIAVVCETVERKIPIRSLVG